MYKMKKILICIVICCMLILSFSYTAIAETDNYIDVNDLYYVLGDCNSDKKINSEDLVLLRTFFFEDCKIDFDGSDVNEDGIINILDIIKIKKVLLGEDI